jgi:hypothetical protein
VEQAEVRPIAQLRDHACHCHDDGQLPVHAQRLVDPHPYQENYEVAVERSGEALLREHACAA